MTNPTASMREREFRARTDAEWAAHRLRLTLRGSRELNRKLLQEFPGEL